MKAICLPFIFLLALTCQPAHAIQDRYQSFNLALTRQHSSLNFVSADKSLTLQGVRLGYQYGIAGWRVGLDYNRANDSQGQPSPLNNHAFNLTADSSALSFFAEYNWRNSWLGLGYGDSHYEHHYRFFDGSRAREGADEVVNYASSTLDWGYLMPIETGQWRLTASLIHQRTDEKSHYFYSVAGQRQDSISHENGLLAGMGLYYGHYLTINRDWQLYLNLGLYRQVTLEGEARIQYARRPSSATASQSAATQSASSSQQLQASLLHARGSIDFNVDKLADQDLAQAYYSLGLGVNF